MNPFRPVSLLAIAVVVLASCGSDDAPTASFTSPADGATIAGGVHVEMTADGITIEEAGEAREGAGHFHLIADQGCTPTGQSIGKDADHVHFGKAQTEGVIYLEPGLHELCLQVGDGTHSALDVTDTIKVNVGIETQAQWCAVVGDVDEMFDAVDNSSDDFATKQIGYENIRRLATQLSAGIDVVDADARDDVRASVKFAADVVSAFTSSPDFETAERALVPVFESMPDGLSGAGWILDTCDVDINA